MIHSNLRSLYSYWDALRAGRRAPMRSDVDPRRMSCDVRSLFIMENLGHGNIRFRVAGTAIVEAFGMELRGMNARAIMAAAARESFSALIGEVLEDPGVGYARLRSVSDGDAVWEISLLPLRSDFGMIDRVIGCLHPLTNGTAGPGRVPLRFRIETMAVEPITATVIEDDLPVKVSGFAEEMPQFQAPEAQARKPRLRTIEGGRDPEERTARTTGHLRVVDD